MVPDRYSHIVLIIELKISHVMSQKQRKGSVGVRSERCRLLDGNLLTSLSTALEVSPYRVQVISLHRDPIGVDNRSLGLKN